jgi:hypothetical protein
VGFASGNKDAMVSRLMLIAQNQMQALEMGLPIVQPQNVYETMLELTKAGDFASPERFWTLPEKAPQQQPPPPDPALVKAQADSAAKEAELTLQQEEGQREAELKAVELQLRDKEITTNAALKDKEINTKAELEKYRIDTDAALKLKLAEHQAQTQRDLAQHDASVKVHIAERQGETARELEDKRARSKRTD